MMQSMFAFKIAFPPRAAQSSSPTAYGMGVRELLFPPALMVAWATIVSACSFCEAPSRTLSDELRESKTAVVARCESVSAETDGIRVCRMRIVDVVKGDAGSKNSVVEIRSSEELPRDEIFWLVAYDEWTSPKRISAAAVSFLRGLSSLPADSPQRLCYFLPFLQHSDRFIADDAFNEFARASSEDIAALEDKPDRRWIVAQLRKTSVPQNRRRLYWTFLSQCGDATDTRVFDELVSNRQTEPTYEALDAAIACYITLGGDKALARIERDYLENSEAEYTDTFAAIRAIRVHGDELNSFSRQRLAAALRCVLDQPPLADLVMRDLARWEDWSAMGRIVELFETATEETSFLKPAAVRYLNACPLPAGTEALDKLRAIDPQTVRRIEALMSPPSPPSVAPTSAPSAISGSHEPDAPELQ